MALVDPIEDVEGLRFVIFASVLGTFLVLERLAPRRERVASSARRLWTNGVLMVTGAGVMRLLVPAGVVGAALWADANGVGLLNVARAPEWLAIAASMVVFDLALWLQHVASHRWGWLWRMHRVHHADLDLDATSGVRFHPAELVVSVGWKCVVVVALGAPPIAVVASEVLLNAFAIFTHANLNVPKALDGALRRVLVTPDVHRIHHSVEHDESNRNFGFALILWDRVFGTFVDAPRHEQATLPLGLDEIREERVSAGALAQLGLPLRRAAPPKD